MAETKVPFQERIEGLRDTLNQMDWSPDGENVKQGYRFLSHEKIKGNVSKALVANHVGFSISFCDLAQREAIGNMSQHNTVTAHVTLYDIYDPSIKMETTVYGSAADSGDKSISKAQTNAFKNYWANQFMLSFYTPYDEIAEEVGGSVRAEGGSGFTAKKEIAKAVIMQSHSAEPTATAERTAAGKKPITDTQKTLMSKIMNKATTVNAVELESIGTDITEIGTAYNKALGADDSELASGFIMSYKKVMALQ